MRVGHCTIVHSTGLQRSCAVVFFVVIDGNANHSIAHPTHIRFIRKIFKLNRRFIILISDRNIDDSK